MIFVIETRTNINTSTKIDVRTIGMLNSIFRKIKNKKKKKNVFLLFHIFENIFTGYQETLFLFSVGKHLRVCLKGDLVPRSFQNILHPFTRIRPNTFIFRISNTR